MEVLIDGTTIKHEKETVVCTQCKSVLEVGNDDFYYDKVQEMLYVMCPVCKKIIPICEDDKILTLDNIIYPFDFDNNSVGNGAINIDNDTINEDITELVKQIRNDNTPKNEQGFVCKEYGNLFLIIFNDNIMNEYRIIVAKNYEEAIIFK